MLTPTDAVKATSTNIIRRIDDLGRVVIPKEIRRNYNITEGEELMIYTGENCIAFVPVKALEAPCNWDYVKERFEELTQTQKIALIKELTNKI